MPDIDLMEIKISKIIHAQKAKVMRLVTRVDEFPSFVPCVKEVSVIQRDHRVMKTKWRVELEKVPITWTEEDIISAGEDTIYFKATEGDLEEFEGKWLFQDHPEGTQVSINVYVKIGIPAIKDFAEGLIKKLITANFEAILDALEHRLISLRYAGYKKDGSETIAGFGIVWHLYNLHHLEKSLKMLNGDFKMPSPEFINQLLHITPSFKFKDILNFKSKTGQEVNGCFLVATFIPDMIEQDIWSVFSRVVKACKVAEKYGVGIVVLGGFSALVTEKIEQPINEQLDVPVTTGNAFTTAMAIDAVFKACGLLNLELQSSKVAIIGGAGHIGSACARLLAGKVSQITLADKTKTGLNGLKQELEEKHRTHIAVSSDYHSAVRDADIVIAAASVSASILNPDWFKPGAVVCDVGYPRNIHSAPSVRNDVFIFSGGLSTTPSRLSLPFDVGLPNEDTVYGCFAEAIILALENRFESFSFAKTGITPEKVEEIRKLGLKHGFEVSDFYYGDKKVDESVIGEVKKIIRRRR